MQLLDPAMADGGKLYSGFDDAYVAAMRALIPQASVITPNLTEAQLLLGQQPDLAPRSDENATDLAAALTTRFGVQTLVTGIPLLDGSLAVAG
ncbi:bifunctional hydroxymethylpyrimidine kinase/phosphomethylpyrimidine kinase, partial [Lacticaseibacillus camelliae]|uniref:bifunctional hydroxymethylpyrimidine kinase/phosphomethylpyrimidine kinase n=1 Tax=Lacticaseibacillus camelliae TaxID=381742 RepID=UPI00156B713E